MDPKIIRNNKKNRVLYKYTKTEIKKLKRNIAPECNKEQSINKAINCKKKIFKS